MFVNDHTKCELNLSKSCCNCNIGPVTKTAIKRSCPVALPSLKDMILNSCESTPYFPYQMSIQFALCQGTLAISICQSTYSPYPMSIQFAVTGNISYLHLSINIFPLPNEHPVCCDREHQLSPSVNQHIPLTQ